MTKYHEELTLKKHVGSIHCSNNMTLLQRKIFNVLLYNAYDRLLLDDFHYIPYKRLSELIGYNSRDLMTLKKAIRSLESTVVEWNILKPTDSLAQYDKTIDEGEVWVSSTLLASVMIDTKNKICRYEYSRTLKQMLHQPEVYARINLAVQIKFNSAYGLALYENCIRFKNVRSTGWIKVGVFRKLMGVNDDRYPIFRDFNRRVLVPAIKDVNAYSDIMLSLEVRRVGQKVIALRFSIETTRPMPQKIFELPKPKAELTSQRIGNLEISLINIFGFSEQMVKETLTKFEISYIQEKIDIIICSENFIAGKIRGLAGYLIEALKKDYKRSQSSKTVIEEKRKKQNKIKKEDKRKEESRAERYAIYINKKIRAYLSTLNEVQNQELTVDFVNYLETQNSIIQGWHRKFGLEHPGIKSSFNHFIQETRKEHLGEILSRENFALIDESNF